MLTGVLAAVPIPRDSNGALDEPSFVAHLAFLLDRGIRGFAVNGATGEFCLTTTEELRRLTELAVATCAASPESHATILCGIGAAGIHGCIDKGRTALAAGATGLLLPMPYFFPYEQDDLEAFCRQAALALPAEILLYNLPQFSTGLQPETVLRLLETCPNIAGIKDSSGNLDILRAVTESGLQASRVVGSDKALAPALHEGVCDAVISGVASALPELIQAVYESPTENEPKLKEFIAALAPLPVPWGLKWAAEARAVCAASFSQPVSPKRQQQAANFKAWFERWLQLLPLNRPRGLVSQVVINAGNPMDL